MEPACVQLKGQCCPFVDWFPVSSIWGGNGLRHWRVVGCKHRQKQKEHQEDLLRRVNEETLRALRQRDGEAPLAGSGRKVSEVESYRSIGELPPVRDLVIQVILSSPIKCAASAEQKA